MSSPPSSTAGLSDAWTESLQLPSKVSSRRWTSCQLETGAESERCKRSGRHSLRHPGSTLGISLNFIGKLGTGLVDAWIYLRMTREYGHDGMTCTSGELETRHRTYAQNRHPTLVLRTPTKAGTGSQSLMAKLSLWYSAARGWLSPTNHDTSGAKTLQGPTSAHLDSEEWLGWSKCGCASDTQQSTSQGSI